MKLNFSPRRTRSSRRFEKIIYCCLSIALFASFAVSQQSVQFINPSNAAPQSVTLSVGSRQIYPLFYPAENYALQFQAGTNVVTLNPGTWTVLWPGSYSTTFTVATNTPATNNWLSLATNPPPAFQAFGLTTNVGVVWTNGTTLVTNQFCFTNGILCAIH